MKTVNQGQLKKLKKKGKVRRKMGAQPVKEQPVVVAPDGEGMSGSAPTEQPSPVLTPGTDEKPYASMAASMAAHNESMNTLIGHNTDAIREFSEKLDTMKPEEKTIWQRASFIRHTVKRSKDKLIEHVDSIPMEISK